MRFSTKTDRGVAGLTILLSLVTMMFVIGLLVMIFALMGAELQTANLETETVSTNETITLNASSISSTIVHATDCGFTSWNASSVINITDLLSFPLNNTLVEGADYTIFASNGTFGNITNDYNVTAVTYTYSWGGESCDVINDTTVAISSVTDWFEIFVVIGAMVVLILLTVIIITAIKGSGLMDGTG